jgi:hypothetical protein
LGHRCVAQPGVVAVQTVAARDVCGCPCKRTRGRNSLGTQACFQKKSRRSSAAAYSAQRLRSCLYKLSRCSPPTFTPAPPPLNHRQHTPPTPPPPSPQVNFSVSSLSASNLTVDNLSVKNVEYSKVDRCAAAWLSCEYAVCVSVLTLDFAPFFRVAFGWCSGLSHAGGRGVRNSVRAGVFEVRV